MAIVFTFTPLTMYACCTYVYCVLFVVYVYVPELGAWVNFCADAQTRLSIFNKIISVVATKSEAIVNNMNAKYD